MLQHSYASLISINTFHQWICSRGITKLQSSELGTVDRIRHVIHHIIHLLQYNSKHIDHLFQSSSTQFNTYTQYISGKYSIFQEISSASLEGRFPHSAATRKSPWQLPQRPGIRNWRSGEALLNRGDLQVSNMMI